MTIRKQWIRTLVLFAVGIVMVNSIVLMFFMNRSFNDYLSQTYNENTNNIVRSTQTSIENKASKETLEKVLDEYLASPIVGITVYDTNRNILASVKSNMMNNEMMSNMMNNTFKKETEKYNITLKNSVVGKVDITKYSSINGDYTVMAFKRNLILGTIIIAFLVIIIAILISILKSKKMIEDLEDTEKLAYDINLGAENNLKLSKIEEIKFIQMSLQDLNNKLKLKQKARKQLLDEMIHQTRTPLTILKAHIEGYQDGVLDMDEEELSVCESQIDNVTDIISNISKMIESEEIKDKVIYEDVEIKKLLSKIVKGLKVQFNKKNISIDIVGEEVIVLNTDKYKVSQSIYNLLTNSYKFTPNGGSVVLSYRLKEEYLEVSVSDSGIGIEKEEIERIFEPYYRGGNIREIKGEGVGLYVVKQNIEKLNGEVEIFSEKGKGTTVKILLKVI